jgi:hypothetical protein
MTATLAAPLKRVRSVSDPRAVIAVYDSHSEAEAAVKELRGICFDMKRLSAVGKDYFPDKQMLDSRNTGDRMKDWGKTGALWSGWWGLLFGAAFFSVPGLGPLIIAGPLSVKVAAFENAALLGGLSVLGAGLYSLGIPENSALRCETAVEADKYLLVAQGSEPEIARAKQILNVTNPAELDEHVLTGAEPALAS